MLPSSRSPGQRGCCMLWVGETRVLTGWEVGLASSSPLHLFRVRLTAFGLKIDHKSSLLISLFKYLIQSLEQWQLLLSQIQKWLCSQFRNIFNRMKRYSQPIWTRQYADFVVRLKRNSRSHHLNYSGMQEWKYQQSFSKKLMPFPHSRGIWLLWADPGGRRTQSTCDKYKQVQRLNIIPLYHLQSHVQKQGDKNKETGDILPSSLRLKLQLGDD